MAKYASKVIEQAKSWLGYNEADGTHKKIIDVYNSHKPLARGYVVKYTDSWCATFVSAVSIKLGYTDIIPTECSCIKMIQLLKNIGSWVESDSYVPKSGDILFYDWYDSGVGDNTTAPDHVGIVEKVEGDTITVIEGNYSNSVKRRTIKVNGKYIRGYGVPKYDKQTATNNNATVTNNNTAVYRNYLMKGDKGADVKIMQESLIKLGYSCGSYGADGDFGSGTEVAVKAFQKANGLTADGKYGEKSKAKVDELLKKVNTSAPAPNKIDTVKEVQNWINTNYGLGIIVDGIYGSGTKKALVKILQTELNQTYGVKLVVDGIWGVKTKAACPTLRKGAKNDIVCVLQALLVCNGHSKAYVDGSYGSGTYEAVKLYQGKKGLSVDGIAGQNTFAKLCG